MTKLGNPTPLFLDARGALLDGGRIYVGAPDADPETTPIDIFYDPALTIAAAQPLRTLGGRIVDGNTPVSVFTAGDDYSMRVRDAQGVLIDYTPSIYTDAEQFQPRDADLTAISALATTPYGRALLTLANQAALKAATGIPDALPLTGGTMTGDIRRQGSGAYLFNTNADYVGGGVFITPAGASDPTVSVGDIWIELAP